MYMWFIYVSVTVCVCVSVPAVCHSLSITMEVSLLVNLLKRHLWLPLG